MENSAPSVRTSEYKGEQTSPCTILPGRTANMSGRNSPACCVVLLISLQDKNSSSFSSEYSALCGYNSRLLSRVLLLVARSLPYCFTYPKTSLNQDHFRGGGGGRATRTVQDMPFFGRNMHPRSYRYMCLLRICLGVYQFAQNALLNIRSPDDMWAVEVPLTYRKLFLRPLGVTRVLPWSIFPGKSSHERGGIGKQQQ